MPKLTKDEESIIIAIHNDRHNTNEVLLIMPWVVALFFSLIGVPIITVVCETSYVWNITLFIGPVLVVTLILLARKKIICRGFLKERDIKDKVEMSWCASEMYSVDDGERILMFVNSENMPMIVYNWFKGLGVLKDDCLKMCRIVYDNRAANYFAVSMDDLQITDAVYERFDNETKNNARFSDYDEMGRLVNVRLYARLAKNQMQKN